MTSFEAAKINVLLFDPAAIEPRWWPMVLGRPGRDPSIIQYLLATDRSRTRLANVIYDAVGIRPSLVRPEDPFARLLALDIGAWRQTLERFGLFWNGRAIARIVEKRALENLVQRVGVDAYRRVIASPELWVNETLSGSAEAVVDQLFDDGALCLQGWLASQPDVVARQVALRLCPRPAAAAVLTSASLARARAIVEQELSLKMEPAQHG